MDSIVMEDFACIIGKMQQEFFEQRGFGWFRVRSGSMWPLIDVGDEVLVHRTEPFRIKRKDIVLFKLGTVFIVHRVIGVFFRKGRMIFLQQGDAGSLRTPVPSDFLVGRVVAIRKEGVLLPIHDGYGRVLSMAVGNTMNLFNRVRVRSCRLLEKYPWGEPIYKLVKTIYKRSGKCLYRLSNGLVRMLFNRVAEL